MANILYRAGRFLDTRRWLICISVYLDAEIPGKTTLHLQWDLSASYYFNSDDVRKPWTILQVLGEVGVRTLGLSYASERFSGTGMLFAMAQLVYRQEYESGFSSPESTWMFDARALQLPYTLSQAWKYLTE